MSSNKPASRPEFKLSVFTDEVSDDFEHACRIAAEEWGLKYVELRVLWGKNIMKLTDEEIARAQEVLTKFNLEVTAIASPLFKVDWPGAPVSKFSATRNSHGDDSIFEEQVEVLKRSIELAKLFKTGHVRCFDFWRLDDREKYRPLINEKLKEAAEVFHANNLLLMVENEHDCNTGDAAEAVETLRQVQHPAFKLVWDPGNAFYADETPFPDGYELLPKERIVHVHIKDALRKPDGTKEFCAVGKGQIDYVNQFRALIRDGYSGPVVLETHWKENGNAEEGSRKSMAGLKEALKAGGAAYQ